MLHIRWVLCAFAATAIYVAPCAARPRKVANEVTLAQAVARVGQWGMATRMFREATQTDPSSDAAWAGLGEALLENGQAAEALSALRRAEMSGPLRKGGLAPAPGIIARLTGRALIALGRGPEAETAFRAATAALPADPRAWVGLGVALDLQHQTAPAQVAYARALALDPLNVPARNDVALSLALAGDPAHAADQLRVLAVTAGEHAPRVLGNLALVDAARNASR